jgi:hypothetical protein
VRTSARKLTKQDLAGFFADYRSAFPDWDVEHDVVLVRSHGLLEQRIAFEALRSGAYRPSCAVYVRPADAQLLFRFLDVKHREVRPREHTRKWPLVLKAMEEQYEPPIRALLSAADVLRRAEEEATRDSISNVNLATGLAVLNAHLERTDRALDLCMRIDDMLENLGRPPADWEVERAQLANRLRDALQAGRHQALLEELAARVPRAR